MLVYRIERQLYFKEILSGQGAALSQGNRWNSLHTAMVYTSGSRSLAILEVLTRVDLFSDLPDDRLLVELEIPDNLFIEKVEIQTLPKNWNNFPPNKATQSLGDSFIRKASFPIFQVPSSLVKGEFNFLINPMFAGVSDIQIISAEPLDLKRWRLT
jgi:RES domain-containing protein